MDLIIKLSCVSSSQKKTVAEDIVCHVVCMLGEIISYLGLPKSLITEEFVLEGYVEYRQMPNSCSPLYEFCFVPASLIRIPEPTTPGMQRLW